MTDLKGLIDEVEEALQAAWNGLTWYREEHPQDASEADNEMDEQIEAALTRLAQLREAVPEGLDIAFAKTDLIKAELRTHVADFDYATSLMRHITELKEAAALLSQIMEKK